MMVMKIPIVFGIVLLVIAFQVNAQQTPTAKLIGYAAIGNNEKVKLLLENNHDIINEKSFHEDISVGIFQFHILHALCSQGQGLVVTFLLLLLLKLISN